MFSGYINVAKLCKFSFFTYDDSRNISDHFHYTEMRIEDIVHSKVLVIIFIKNLIPQSPCLGGPFRVRSFSIYFRFFRRHLAFLLLEACLRLFYLRPPNRQISSRCSNRFPGTTRVTPSPIVASPLIFTSQC